MKTEKKHEKKTFFFYFLSQKPYYRPYWPQKNSQSKSRDVKEMTKIQGHWSENFSLKKIKCENKGRDEMRSTHAD